VDTSDHEVNIKILLDRVVAQGDLTGKQRNELLVSMTDEVSDLVLDDNYDQNLALANAEANAPGLMHVHEDWMRRLERQGLLNRELEFLPSRKQVAERLDRGQGLTAPELSVLLSYTKIVLADELLETDLADDPFLRSDLFSYFPSKMRQHYRQKMEDHPLRREIIVTQIVNELVNGAGTTYFHRLSGETGSTPAEITRANFIAREIFGSRGLMEEIASYDNKIDAAVQTRMRLEARTLVERASRWLVTNRRPPIDSEAVVDFFEVVVQRVMGQLPELLTGRELDAFEKRRDALVAESVPEDLARKIAVLPPSYAVLGVVETAHRDDLDPIEVVRLHFTLGERLGLPSLATRILALPRKDRWQTMARASLRDELHSVHAQLTAQVLAETDAADSVAARVSEWESAEEVAVTRAVATLEEIYADDKTDLARLSVGLRVVRGLLAMP
jgi:glutamate dehydrogenase